MQFTLDSIQPPHLRQTNKAHNANVQSLVTFADLQHVLHSYIVSERHRQRIQSAYELAEKAHRGVRRQSGEPYIQHPLEVALLLAEMYIDADGIIAALLHDVVEDTDYTLDDLRQAFGSQVTIIVDGVTKFTALARTQGEISGPSPDEKRRSYAETVRKLLVAMAEEPRVIALKIADRVHNMRTLVATSPAHQRKTSLETREIYIPLAKRLGMARAQAELEDLAFLYLDPERYAALLQDVKENMEYRLPLLNEIGSTLQTELQRAGLHATIQVCQKHLVSIKRKLEFGPLQPLEQIHDLLSLRILVETDRECYMALGRVHSLWKAKDGCIKDYIATPKLNGYQSLHTTVFALGKSLIEMQIRTPDMQRTADYGLASYWYLQERLRKEGQEKASTSSWWLSYREMVSWITQLRQWQRELPQNTDEFVEAFKADTFQEQIFVFTPKGEVKDLPGGSTPLDMAYRIHPDLGNHCAGARVTTINQHGLLDTRLVPLDYELKDGEIVDIQIHSDIHPTREWLLFARTAAARSAIRRALQTLDRSKLLHLKQEPPSDLPEKADQREKESFPPSPNARATRLASCCAPLPGDPIIGAILPQEDFIVHQLSCKQIDQARQNTAAQLIKVDWESIHAESYLVPVLIRAHDRAGLIRDISIVIADANLNMTSVASASSHGSASITVTIQFEASEHFLAQLASILHQLQGVKNVIEAQRASNSSS
ncbi:RelA/SpoT family protein [Ktedonospora formicarum]|uniref:GTP pyrophosphokinase n=1 Tax=Ktedonospora formicarum TaxID=2778364 RepID=A0A8J3I6N6_9CHLR|nr:RelA/SpoT family protein [Ktedonospora formicarum]GHO46848.1 hypothetical protein KSX_50110 [Ktedonospora formicarum]